MKQRIILYNPAAPYYTLPLQFLALSSVLDREKYEIEIIDARIEKNLEIAHRRVRELSPGALCLGISIITGTPIKDACDLTNEIKNKYPELPVVWGGWHPSIYPEQCLREGKADYCVSGQGEITFKELLAALEAKSGFENILGLSFMQGNTCITTGERKFIDINQFPSYDYGLIPLEEYFLRKGKRQIDFYSSQGCPYRCGFCADPYVYNRRWSGLRGARMSDDVFRVAREHRVEDVVFQDENFFANRGRVADFSQSFLEQGMNFTWSATSRADQIAPLDDGFLAQLRRANLRKVIIGAESGSQEVLDFMKKDTLTEETLVSAEKLARHDIGASFNFIVGFPEETFEDTLKTLHTIKSIKKISGSFDFNIFFFTPYPGTELFDYIVARGYRVPSSLSQWSDIDFIIYSGYWVSEREKKYVERFKFYTKLATDRNPKHSWTAPLRMLAKARTARDYFQWPIEKEIADFIRYEILHEVNW